METLGLQDANEEIPMQRSTPIRKHSLMEEEQPVDIWRIHWAWRHGNGSGSHTELFDNRRSFERRLFELAIQADANQHGQPESLNKRRWIDVLFERKKIEGDESSDQRFFERCDRIVRVEHLQDGKWALYRWGVSAPKLVIEEQV